MSKERIKPRQFCYAEAVWKDEGVELGAAQVADLGSLYAGIAQNYKSGKIVTGTILRQSADGVLVDIGFKSDGLIPLYEFNEVELKKMAPGAAIEVVLDELENADGSVLLSYEKAKERKAWARIMQLFNENKPVEGVVLHKVKGGLSVDIGVPAFLPGSQVDVQRVADFDQFVGQTIQAYVIKVNQKRGNVIISRRKFLSEQRADSRKKILETLSVGQILPGIVKNITNYGVFIDIGGVDGLLHITDMTWGRIAHPSELVKIGDSITVQVLALDKEHEKISLGYKQLQGNPWEQLNDAIQVGARVAGTVSSITDYGLFVEVAKGVEGLVHISEISWTDRIADLHKSYKVGDTVEALVVSLDKENRRMSLSIKQLEKNPWDVAADQFTVGQHITGKISNITDFGVFVQLMPGIDGLIHVSDLSWTEHIKHPADVYTKGQEISAVITDINKQKKKISLSVKHLSENPWEQIEQAYPVGSLVEGEVTRMAEFGAFVRLPNGIEGLVHVSEVSSDGDIAALERVLQVGQKAEFRVLKINTEEHRLTLGLNHGDDEEAAEKSKARAAKRVEKASQPRQQQQKPAARAQRRPAADAEPVASHATSTGGKAKSQLQLELERHVAKMGKDTSKE